MLHLLYTLLVHLLLPVAFAHLLWRARRQPEYLHHWGERLGFYPTGAEEKGPLIWLHAVSVGETRAAEPLIKALMARYPAARFLLTHMTPTGRATSEALFGASTGRAYLPYDTPWAMRRFLRHFRPSLGIVLETELWPNCVAACRQLKIPLLLVNARLSERSARRYGRWPRLARQTLQGFAAIAAQSAADAARFAALGAEKVTVTGNLKFDVRIPASLPDLRSLLGQRRVFLCASTRDGEEELILSAWRAAAARIPEDVLLALVPRHPQRFDEVERLIRRHGFSCQRRSSGQAVAATTAVWLGDSMGELFAYYAAAELAFVGGSLLDYGGQNLIEPCAVGEPVLLGPSIYNFAAAAADALAVGAARQVSDAAELVTVALALLADAPARQAMGQAGREFAAAHRGATERTLALLEEFFPARRH